MSAADAPPAKRYLVTEHGAVACAWYYDVEAASAEEAIALVRAGEADPFDSETGDTLSVPDVEEISAVTEQENLL